MHDPAPRGGQGFLQAFVQRIERGGEQGAVHGGDVVFVEVDFGFHLGQEVQAGCPHLADGVGQTARQLVGGDGEGRRGGRGHQVRDGLGLGKVQAAIEEGAQGEFARAGGAGAGGQQAVQHAAQGHRAAVAAEFGHVLAGVGAWAGHEEQQGLVDQLVVAVEDLHEVRVAGSGVAGAAGDAAGDPQGFRPTHANHADATAPQRGGNGGDGVGCGGAGVHERCAGALDSCVGGFYGRRQTRHAGR